MKAVRILLGGFVFASTVIGFGLFLPFSIDGNWVALSIGCMCDSKEFLRFENGRVLIVSNGHLPPKWIGDYTKVSTGKYKLMFPNRDLNVSSKLLRISPYEPLKIVTRDLNYFSCWRILAMPGQNVVRDKRRTNVTVDPCDNEKPYYLDIAGKAGMKNSAKQLEELFGRKENLKKTRGKQMVVYAPDGKIPEELDLLLTRFGFVTLPMDKQILTRTGREQGGAPPLHSPSAQGVGGR